VENGDLLTIDSPGEQSLVANSSSLVNLAISASGGAVMKKASSWIYNSVVTFGAIQVGGCASTQLNFNTLDLASTVDSLVISQVLSNLAKFSESPFAIPSQVALASGTVTTNNTITPSITSPLNLGLTATNTLTTMTAATVSKSLANTSTRTQTNATATLNGTDQWTQTWGISPLTDPDQLRRLRVLYQFGAGHMSRQELLCNYPIVGNKAGASSTGGASTTSANSSQSPSANLASAITYPTKDGKTFTISFGGPPQAKKRFWIRGCKTEWLEITSPDPAFLNPPSCVICDDTDKRYRARDLAECDMALEQKLKKEKEDKLKKEQNDKARLRRQTGDGAGEEQRAENGAREEEQKDVCLYLNYRLQNGWFRYSNSALDVPSDAIFLGHYQDKYLYLQSMQDVESFYEFVLFIVEATTLSATSSTGKGAASKTAPQLGGPSILLQ
jgi:hypothetical protein